ncbi:MAG: hypothetical protein AB1757_16150 [Acidobacteriota bacterium]
MKIFKPNPRNYLGQMATVFALSLSILMAGELKALAQSTVEKLETTQQAKKSEDELALARAAVIKPTDKSEKPDTGSVIGNYTVKSSIELGYRWVDIGGNAERYRSDLNVRDGFRVLDFSIDARSIDPQGALFDFLRADASNVGGDQTQYFSLRVDKTRYYKFDGKVRRFYYYRSQANIANNQHNWDIRQQVSDFNLKLFPQRAVRVNLGYGRSSGTGPFVTTYNSNDQFLVEGNARWEANDYRAGFDASINSWNIFGEYLFRGFRNDSEQFQKIPLNRGNNITDTAVLNFFDRDTPIRSDSVIVRGAINGNIGNRVHVLLQGMHNDEDAKINQYDIIAGVDTSNRTVNRLILTTSNAKRPSKSVDALLSVDVAENVTISNTSRFYRYRILGNLGGTTATTLRTVAGATTNTLTTSTFRHTTDVTSYWNTLQLQFGRGRSFSGNVGWRYTFRDVKLINTTTATTAAEPETERENTNTFIGGLRLRPVDRANFFFDYENGSSDNVFVRVAPLDYQRFRVRANIGITDALSFNTTFTATDKTNPTPQVENDSDYRAFSTTLVWEPQARFWITGGYNYDSVKSTANIAYFISSVLNTGRSRYYSRQHFMFFDSRVGVTNRLDLFFVYRYIKDLGAPGGVGFFPAPLPNDFITSLPLKRHNPEARLSFRINNHATANVSYRHYSYNEKFNIPFFQSYTSSSPVNVSPTVVGFNNPDYRANIVTTSMRFTF